MRVRQAPAGDPRRELERAPPIKGDRALTLKQARHAVLPAAALAAWGVTVWAAADGLDSEDVIPTGVAVVLSVWSLMVYQYRRFWRDTSKVSFERTVTAVAEGVRAEMQGCIEGDGRRAPGPRTGA